MLTALNILGTAILAVPLIGALYDLITDAPAARATALAIALVALALAIGAHIQ